MRFSESKERKPRSPNWSSEERERERDAERGEFAGFETTITHNIYSLEQTYEEDLHM